MEYIHPKQYKGIRNSNPRKQQHTRAIVEEYCFKCDRFCGKEHDFSNCRMTDIKFDNKVIEKTCPFGCVAVPVIDLKIKCKVEGED